MANVYCDSVAYTAVPQFAVSHAYVSTSNGGRGDYIRQLAAPSVGNERVFRCTTSGTSAGAEPTWTLTKNGTTTSGGATFTECTGQEADQGAGGAAWKAPHARWQNCIATWVAAGDTVYFGTDHLDAATADTIITFPGTLASPNYFIAVSPTSSIPPVASDVAMAPSAKFTNTASHEWNWSGSFYAHGLDISTPQFIFPSQGSGDHQVFKKCNLSAAIIQGALQADSCTLTNQINVGQQSIFKNCVITGNGTIGAAGGCVLMEGCNLTGMTGNILTPPFPFTCVMKDCALPAGVPITSALSGQTIYQAYYDVIRCDFGSGGYRSERHARMGDMTTEIAAIRTIGASDGVTAVSWKAVTSADSKWIVPFELLPITEWNTVVQNNINVTLEGIASPVSFSALPNNDDFWFDVEYLGASGAPLGSFAGGTKANILATGVALTASSSAWDSKATARANSTAYNQGDVFKLASNTGRLFFCTTAGTTAGSEPGGYATAIDGGSVTDGTATFKAGWRFKQTITLASPQPQMVGPITVYPKMAKASATLYLDPLITLS